MSENRVPALVAALTVLYTLSVIFTALRVYVRVFISKNWGVDDTLLVVTLAVFTVYTAMSAAGIHYGIGRHIQDIPMGDIPKALMYWFSCELLYTATTVLLRLSIAVFLLRICVRRAHRYLIFGTMIMVAIFSIFYFSLAILQCQPTSYFWDQYAGEEGSCIDKAIFPDATFAHSAVSATADFVLGILPVCIIWDLKMNLRTKVSVGVVLSLGVIAGLGALIRIPYIRILAITDDFLYGTVDVAIWSTVEPALGIVAAAACVLRPLFKKFYDLSTRGTYPSQGSAHAYALHKSRNVGMITAREGLELIHDVNETNRAESVITSAGHMTSMSNHVTLQSRDSKGVTFLSKNASNSSSQEELTPIKGGGIQVHKTVEVVRTNRRGDDDRSWRGTNSHSSSTLNPPNL